MKMKHTGKKGFTWLPITIAVAISVTLIVVVILIYHYPQYREQYARRECAGQIAQAKTDNKQAITSWEAQCQLKRDEYYQKQTEEYEQLRTSSVEASLPPSLPPTVLPVDPSTLTREQREYQQIRERLEESGHLQRARDTFEYNSLKEARQATINGICDIPLGPKPTPLTISPDEELKTIKLCMERKGYK